MDLGQNSKSLDPAKYISCRKQTSRLTQSSSRLGNPERLNRTAVWECAPYFPTPVLREYVNAC